MLDRLIIALLIVLAIYEFVTLVVDIVRWRRKQREKASAMLLQMAIDSFVPCPEEACADCGQETYGEDHACTYLTTVDVACIRRTKGEEKP